MAPNGSLPLHELLRRRFDRRVVLAGAASLAAWSLGAGRSLAQTVPSTSLTFRRVPPSKADAVTIPDGYDMDVVVRWGDPLFPGTTPLDPLRVARGSLLEPSAAEAQARQFGYNCDGIGLFAADGERWLMCVNHEFPLPALLFPGWDAAREMRALGPFVRERPQAVAFMQAAVGLSVVELEQSTSGWRYRTSSPFNRRVTANTPIEIAGPARMHPLLNPRGDAAPIALGTFGNCAAGKTPWRTYLTAEENVDDYFGNGASTRVDEATARAHRRFGFRQRDSAFRWEYADPRFDSAANPTESLKFGWIVELDPLSPDRRPRKRTALGRFKHECATTVLTRDGRAAVYMGDDEQFEYLYKFVSRDRFDPGRPDANRDLLDTGTLYVATFFDDGRGEWRPLVHGSHEELTAQRGFASQADVVLRCREAADRVGATPLDRPEDVAVHPHTGNVYVSCTNNSQRGSGVAEVAGRMLDKRTSGASPRAPNPSGHILELAEAAGDAAATEFRWEVFLLCGTPTAGQLLTVLPAAHPSSLAADATYFGGQAASEDLSAFASPDNLGFDADGNLWIVTDGVQPDGNNDGCFVCPTAGPQRGQVRQFLSGPVGAEVCGCEFAPDGETLFLTLQHPGEAGTAEAPQSHWPDGGAAAPRPSLIAVRGMDANRKIGS